MSAVPRLGEQAAEAVRELNHHTRQPDAFTDPAEICCLLADLTATAQRTPQLLGQLARWLTNEHATTTLRSDNDTPVGEIVTAATTALADAACHADRSAASIDAAHQHLAHLATA